MQFLKLLLCAVTIMACTKDKSNSSHSAESTLAITKAKDQIIQHLKTVKPIWTQASKSNTKSDNDEDNQLVYTASFDTKTCETTFISDPEIESFYDDQYFVFFTNTYNLLEATDLHYEDANHAHRSILQPEFYTFHYEDYSVILIDILSSVECTKSVTTYFLIE